MKQLTNKQPLSYMLPDSHLVTSLPFIDQELEHSIPKSKVNYLIRAQQNEMGKDLEEYLKEMPTPRLEYAESQEFEAEVERVQLAMAAKEREKEEGKGKKKESGVPEPPKKLVTSEADSLS